MPDAPHEFHWAGVYELKEADEQTWYRAIYLSKIGNIIHVLQLL